eukprot:gnl/Chilomastix_caulleri/4939.p6 GENE.gnl/Chilomastix_caulleri/4939~~gnl/Chilomastix_caulleri/4939.p6  ORF type:complete len:60 (-),score=0.10 gnl/Chilomastix_caulleri/4939:461-640(-)
MVEYGCCVVGPITPRSAALNATMPMDCNPISGSHRVYVTTPVPSGKMLLCGEGGLSGYC